MSCRTAGAQYYLGFGLAINILSRWDKFKKQKNRVDAIFFSPPEDKSIRLRDGSILNDAIAQD
jgi:hypothetical protein